ncbi:MAG: tRNA (adenosine(37)-N6)-threonylcarbamoyltransferase complex ATPase subunit type 1 TsaE [Ruminiclostridium sp.]|nr:tRNA (adenosine(37)-N6)-threonylcarbamoyltransferase complex ATPase subunit type 1 TsaE [Ruminiclostridium sp.]
MNTPEVYETGSAEETIAAAERFAASLKAGDTVLYTGEMGAGKTHFTKGIARHFGITEGVASPTFAIVNEYTGGTLDVFHFDLFRISTFDDLYATGFFDYLDRGGIICVEWSENVPTLAENLENVWRVDIAKTGENSRRITIGK